jgi:uncharacterized protein YegP (UPF0339 family)
MMAKKAAKKKVDLKFQHFQDAGGMYRWRLKAGNHKIIADSSEGYVNLQDCLDAIALIQKGAKAATVRKAN